MPITDYNRVYVFSITECIGADQVLSQPVNPVNMPAPNLTDLSWQGWLVHALPKSIHVFYLLVQKTNTQDERKPALVSVQNASTGSDWSVLPGMVCSFIAKINLNSLLARSKYKYEWKPVMASGQYASTWADWFFFLGSILSVCSKDRYKGHIRENMHMSIWADWSFLPCLPKVNRVQLVSSAINLSGQRWKGR